MKCPLVCTHVVWCLDNRISSEQALINAVVSGQAAQWTLSLQRTYTLVTAESVSSSYGFIRI
ncbi:hypothetical protein M404DRAFT_1000958 [Pisolithus tinctorius Marx 270]|uniref:Uncharacterized protein n=1 Tax=Pisolithus tinctorius Marx 270 TaxID=870435 RepID=A0A0C3K3M0_PISTI|nr:hypothetical protein M404DRAFT_1000958 [Pisolithus tinctorius Marx 270]